MNLTIKEPTGEANTDISLLEKLMLAHGRS